MLRYLIERIGLALCVCLAVSILAFTLLNASGDLAVSLAGEEATPAQIEAMREELGLNRPLVVRYAEWLGNAMQGDFGRSLFFHQPVTDLIAYRLPNTLKLASLALCVMLALSVPLGVIAALRPNSIIDRVAMFIAVMGQAMPNFWFALVLIVIFSLTLGWLPPSGSESLRNFILPAIALGYYATPPMMRLIRQGMIEALSSDYIRTARAKGISTPKIVFKHALRNAVIPVVSLLAVQFGNMLGGSVVIETVFGINGLGYLAWESISRMDLPVVQATLMIVALFYVVMVLASDIINAWLDPRIRIK
ncbi:peptide/nickel transport system permease protein [Ketogulonicigenium robustum]|uniref:Peptide/nickel transport system permease protein n=1 Tax=Ketogulonicigenium robustum TaxID=92947 RepID=A0A1W6P1Y5_9RHOB|nr:ABC transporter permease [Ketogulonicigenium robustum]ARO15307.1 peptide/nickel transport system permease protein [Ketogulonicigenium robustum]